MTAGARVFSIFLFAGLLLWPLAWIVLHGATLTGVNEESTGYRYFYTLRQLYDPPVFLFLPQGQLTNLIQKAIQVALTLLDFPATQLLPRIDYFCYASVAVFHLMNVAAFAWLSLQLRSAFTCVASALFWALLFYTPDLSARYTLIQPDYVAVDVFFPILAAASILRVSRSARIDIRAVILFGLFFGAAAATKITLILFPAVAFGYAILRAVYEWRELTMKIAGVTIAAGAAWFFIVFLDHGLSPLFFHHHFSNLAYFLRTGGAQPAFHDLSLIAWVIDRAATSTYSVAAIYLAPLFALLCLALCRTRDQFALAIPLLLVALGWTAFLYNRDYPATLLEAAFGLHLIIYTSTVIIFWPNLSLNLSLRWQVLAPALACILSFVFATQIAIGFSLVMSQLESARDNTADQARLAAVQKDIPGKHLWIIIDNSIRPMSIESAIMKGGWNYGWLNPDSPIMRRMFPDLEFRFKLPPRPFRLADYQVVLFSYNDSMEGMIDLISREYSVPLNQWKCRLATKIGSQMIGVCQP